MCRFSIPNEFRHTECHKFIEHWKKENQAKRPGVFCTLEKDLGGVYTREEGRSEGKKGGRKGRKEGEFGVLGRAWNKSQDAQLSWPCCVVLGMFISFLIGQIFLLPYQARKVVVVIEREACENKE